MSGRAASSQWALSADAFHRLLALLDPDPERAGARYEALRRRLTGFFEWRGALWPESLADEVINRVVRRLDGGEAILNVEAYAVGVARIVLLEARRRQERERAGRAALPPPSPPDDPDPRQPCLDACLAALPAGERELILEYYGESGSRIDARKALAARLGVAPAMLRARAFRIRERLYDCVRACLDGARRGSEA